MIPGNVISFQSREEGMTQGKGSTFYCIPVLPLWALNQKAFAFLPMCRLGMLWDQPTFSIRLCTQSKTLWVLPLKSLTVTSNNTMTASLLLHLRKLLRWGSYSSRIFSATLTSYTTNLKTALNNWSVLWKQEVSAPGNSLCCSGRNDSFSILPTRLM